MYNQFIPQYMPQTQLLQPWSQNMPRQEIVKVNGENGAKAYQMAPNSSAILLDESAPLVWLIQTDGAGYKTATPYTISPYQAEPTPDYNALLARIEKLEALINVQKSDAGNARRSKQSTSDAE